ncbi:hypothetical protein E2C01_022292 [Portunus trituberculatus]|uniref:Uncharacterized protein n=1 Tax=Portunus trituberculatus TaxID=210409 RepID=A0A5B7E6W4_PORTR|nr:hypothetical protein [Portunus trituberculatus]
MTGHAQPPPGTSEMVQIDSVYSVALFDANPDLKNLRWAFEKSSHRKMEIQKHEESSRVCQRKV